MFNTTVSTSFTSRSKPSPNLHQTFTSRTKPSSLNLTLDFVVSILSNRSQQFFSKLTFFKSIMDCAKCGKSYPASYFKRHKCKGKQVLRKNFSCTDCQVICTFKSNIIRHYREIHFKKRDEIPLSVLRIKAEKKPRKPCPTCGKGVTQLSNHKCKVKPLIPAQPDLQAAQKAFVSLERLSDKAISNFQSKIQNSTSTGRITRSVSLKTGSTVRCNPSTSKKAPKAVVSLGRRSKKDSSSSESSATASSSSDDDDDDDDDGDSDISHDSIAKPKKPKKVVRKSEKPILPPRTATWRSPSDIPFKIREHIRKVYKDYVFSKIMDHQVRRRIADGSFKFQFYDQLIVNSPGRSGVDAINLIKLVYDEQRARPLYKSPARD